MMNNNNREEEEETDRQYQLRVIDLEHADVDKGLQKRERQTTETRLEVNRQRAKENRKRKKNMTEEMQKQLVLLTLQNNKLRIENQTQQEEITLLRKTSQLLASQHARPPAHTSVAPKGFSNSEIIDIIRGVGNPNDNLSDILQASRYPENTSFRPSTVLSSTIGLGHQTFQNNTSPYGTKKHALD